MVVDTKKHAELSKLLQKDILDMAFNSKTGHIGSAFSISDILTVLYFGVMNIRPEQPLWSDRDYFILSKGHAAAALYAVLARRGFFSPDLLAEYRIDGGKLHGHPCRDAAPGIELSTGSLGHGLSVGAGIALAILNKTPGRVFVLLGDGECNEGVVWEAAMFASTQRLTNLIAIVDRNKFQGFDAAGAVDLMPLEEKWRAFGWDVQTVNGHDTVALTAAFEAAKINTTTGCPSVIIADTVAGKGIAEVENTLLAHYYVPTEQSYKDILTAIYAK